MQQINFDDGVTNILEKDSRYAREAYDFLREALEFTQKALSKSSKTLITRHISGQELLDGIRQYALAIFGPMTVTVFEQWGIKSCEDVGNMVFLMAENQLLRKTDKDSPEDFKNGYSFEKAFREPFLPENKKATGKVREKADVEARELEKN